MVGYSGKPLVQKLGLAPTHRLTLVRPPADLSALLGPLPAGLRVVGARATEVDVALLFAEWTATLEPDLARTARRVRRDGMVWVAWPKRAARVPTDLTEDVVRRFALATGLVDVKVCAISDLWSGLKLVRRLADR